MFIVYAHFLHEFSLSLSWTRQPSAPLTRGKALVDPFSVEEDCDWRLQPSFPEVPHLLKHLHYDVFFFSIPQILTKKTQSDLNLHDCS